MWNDYINIQNYEVKQIDFVEPINLFEKYSNDYGSVLLTGNGDETNSRYSMIGILPNFELKYDKNAININLEQKSGEIWNVLNDVLTNTQFHNLNFPANLCGLIGYATYELGRDIEIIPKTTINSYEMPVVQLLAYKTYFIFDTIEHLAWEIKIHYRKTKYLHKTSQKDNSFKIRNLSQETSKADYIKKVKVIQDYITKGDVYEVNLTQQVSGDFSGNAYDFFKKLYSINDAPYSCFFNLDNLKIVSNSPELFLRAKGREVETRPIKGTIPRSNNSAIDLQNRQSLLNSEKDQAELFMIIDLLRNDLGKVSEIGSVKVKNAKKLEPYKNVYHLVGIVESNLDKKYNYTDLLKATFPGGSITGCPKIRAMEIIDEIETYTRNLYTGSIFIINKEFFNSNIVIRTAIIKDDKIFINSGGAITIDSNPNEEYLEMKVKIKNIMELLEK